ncbi:chorismate-binding protein, partial [Candidatus Pacearchaeota archaeon]|nr:chorismate-binding protein [Candidatus Pacearchaeota archaeon]
MGYLAYPGTGLKNEIPDRLFYEYKDIVKNSGVLKCDTSYQTKGRLEQSVSEEEYVEKIGQIKELLAAGEIYQMCYSIRFRKKFSGDPYALFCKLSKVNPVAFSAFFNAGSFQIVSSSPERLFKVQDG